MRKQYSQKMYLFSVYSVFIFILLTIFFLFTYTHYQTNILSKAKKDSENLCLSIKNALKTELDNLSTISMNIVYSNAIKSNFKQFSQTYPYIKKDPSTLVASREKALFIHDIITAIIGPYQSASLIRLYTMDGSCVEAGYYLKTTSVNLQSIPWYEPVLKLNGYKYFTLPFTDYDLSKNQKIAETQKFVSLIRVFLDTNSEPEGIVEVVQSCEKLFSLAIQFEKSNPESHVYIYNARQELMYPYTNNNPPSLYPEIKRNHIQEGNSKIIKTKSGKSYLFTYDVMSNYNWTVIITTEKNFIYSSLDNFRVVFALIAFFSLIFTLFICLYISQRLTKPLYNLMCVTNKITIAQVLAEGQVDISSANSNIQELSSLCHTIESMYEKLCINAQELLLSKSEETRAKLYATQSLINPHFLYNSLTNISIMAEEEMNDDIIYLCQALCDYFRYISSTQEMIVSLEDELFFTEQYLKCMKFRFSEDLEYHIISKQPNMDIYIPKLIIQPIVENAFKYGFSGAPPWYLTITTHIIDSRWIIKVEDNGGNLTDDKKIELLKLYENLDMDQELKSMQIGGMGLKNIYIRLKLLYGKDAIFEIDNSKFKQTTFIIGGPIYYSKEEYYAKHPKL